MAGTWGFALKGVAGGMAGLPAVMIAKKERERLEKAKKEAERIFQEWYNSDATKEFCANLDTASQGERAYFTTGLLKISKDVFNYFTEIDNDIREGNIAAAKSKNDLVETKIKAATDLAAIGMKATFPDGTPMQISDEDLAFQKQIQIGKTAGGVTGEAMMKQTWETQVGKPLDIAPKLSDLDKKIAGITALPIPEEQKLEMKIKVYGGGDSVYEQQVRDYFEAGGTDEGLRKRFEKGAGIDITIAPETVGTLATWEERFDKVTTEDEFNREMSLLEQSKDVYDPEQKVWKDKLVSMIEEHAKDLETFLDEKGKLKNMDWKADWEKYLDIYNEKIRELQQKFPDVDLSKFPKFKKWSTLGLFSLIDEKGW